MAGCFPAVFNGQLDERCLALSCLSHVLLLRKRWHNEIKGWEMKAEPCKGGFRDKSLTHPFPLLGFHYHLTPYSLLIYMVSVLLQRAVLWRPDLRLPGSPPCHFLIQRLPLPKGSAIITFWMNSGQYIQYYFSRKGRQILHGLLYSPLIPKFWWHNLQLWSRGNGQSVWNKSCISIRCEYKGYLRPARQAGILLATMWGQTWTKQQG